MSIQVQTETLQSFLAYLDGLTGRPPVEELRARLAALEIGLDDVADAVRFGPDRYRRNLLRAGEHYHALVLCWRSGQRSPIHNHASSVCGVRVLTGVATETIFEPTPCGQMKPTVSRDLPAGGVCASQDGDTHQVSNLQAPGRDLVTLHIYSPPLLSMDTYSLSDGSVTRVYDCVDEADGSGI